MKMVLDYNDRIDQEILSFVKLTEEHYPAGLILPDVQAQRDAYRGLCVTFAAPRPVGVSSSDDAISTDGHRVHIRRYTAQDNNAHAHIVYIHGGGYILGDLESHDDVCAELCASTALNVTAIDYRLSPEHKHPDALHDCLGVVRFEAERLQKPLLLCGDSAGGNLCAAVSHQLRNESMPSPVKAQVLLYPDLGGEADKGSYIEHAQAPMLTIDEVHLYRNARALDSSTATEPTMAPLQDTNFGDLPITIVVTAECDPLADDGKNYCDAITSAGGKAQWRNETGLVHGFIRARHLSDRARASFEFVVQQLQHLADVQVNSAEQVESRFAKQWHYRPTVPLETSPLFSFPINAAKLWKWFVNRWLAIGENTVLVVLALVVWAFFQPPLEQTRSFEFGWIFQTLVRNAILISLVAGGLHYLLHARKHQGYNLKFDARDVKGRGNSYTFKNQLYDNIFWTLTSGVFFWTAFEVVMLWCMSNGYISVLLWSEHPILFFLWFLLTPVWISLHFYWIHRFLHWPPLYKLAHGLHHRNTNVGPWSGLSMHPVEHLLFFSSILIHCVVMAHPVHILFHLMHQALTAATSHTGYDALLVKDKRAIELGTFHHQMHHRYFDCNYGSLEMPWDKLFGSFHDGSEESNTQFLARRREMLSQRR